MWRARRELDSMAMTHSDSRFWIDLFKLSAHNVVFSKESLISLLPTLSAKMNELTYWTPTVVCIYLSSKGEGSSLFYSESIPYLVGLLSEAVNGDDRRSNGLEARELCKGLAKLSVANDNKQKVMKLSLLLSIGWTKEIMMIHFSRFTPNQSYSIVYSICLDSILRVKNRSLLALWSGISPSIERFRKRTQTIKHWIRF